MSKILYIKASPRDEKSSSGQLAEAFLSSAKARNFSIEVFDVWKERLPDFDGDRVAAKMNVITGQVHSQRERTVWDEISRIAQNFADADVYLFSIPMWNGSIPYTLKHYIDVIHQPGILFGLDPQKGYFGLLKNKKAFLTYTSGAFSPAAPSPAFGVDHHSTFMRAWLNQAGVNEIYEVRFQPTLLSSDPEGAKKLALDEATKMTQYL